MNVLQLVYYWSSNFAEGRRAVVQFFCLFSRQIADVEASYNSTVAIE
jgi:hypothetical protein